MTDLERIAQVEELHARRAVFADAMNRERLENFNARKNALRCVEFIKPNIAAPCITKQAREDKTVQRLHLRPQIVRERNPVWGP